MSGRDKTFITALAAKSLDLLLRQKGPISAGEFAKRTWPNGRYTESRFSEPAIKGTIALNRFARAGLVYKKDRLWHVTELGIHSLFNFLATFDGRYPYGVPHRTPKRHRSQPR